MAGCFLYQRDNPEVGIYLCRLLENNVYGFFRHKPEMLCYNHLVEEITMKIRWNHRYVQLGVTAFLVIAASILFYYGIFHMKSLITGIKTFFVTIVIHVTMNIQSFALSGSMPPKLCDWISKPKSIKMTCSDQYNFCCNGNLLYIIDCFFFFLLLQDILQRLSSIRSPFRST